MDLSIVTTLYHSSPYLEEFYTRIKQEAKKITDDYEIILVNDGSPDNSLDVAVSLYRRDARVRVIDLSRNFGHHKAMMTGLAHAQGRLVFLIDCDLEIMPENLTAFYRTFQNSTVDVVYGIQETRQDPPLDRLFSRLFYTFFNWLSPDTIPLNLTTVRLMSQRYVSALVSHQEREVLIGGLWAITGFKQLPQVVSKSSKGSSTYHLGRRLAIVVNAVTSFSNRPLILIFYLGCIIISLSSVAAAYLTIETILSGFLPGWPSLIVSVWLLGGLTIFCMGIIGIYLSKIFTETKQRPYTIIRDFYERPLENEYDFRTNSNLRSAVLQPENQNIRSDSQGG
jgi:putative glycosyltransferase